MRTALNELRIPLLLHTFVTSSSPLCFPGRRGTFWPTGTRTHSTLLATRTSIFIYFSNYIFQTTGFSLSARCDSAIEPPELPASPISCRLATGSRTSEFKCRIWYRMCWLLSCLIQVAALSNWVRRISVNSESETVK